MFGNPVKKLNGLIDEANAAFKADDAELCAEKLGEALRFMSRHDKETSNDFFAAQASLASTIVMVGDIGKGDWIFRDITARMEKAGADRTALYAGICMRHAQMLRTNAANAEGNAREILEKGLRRALEGKRDELINLSGWFYEYLGEIAQFELQAWIPDLYKTASAAYMSKVGEAEAATSVMYHAFAQGLQQAHSPEDQAQALEAADRALRIAVKTKMDPEEAMELVISKANILDALGRTEEAIGLLREAIGRMKCKTAIDAALGLAIMELYLEGDPARIEAALDQTLRSIGTPAPQQQIFAYGIKGYCAARRGDEAAVTALAAAIEKVSRCAPEAEDDPIELYAAEALNRLAAGLLHAGRNEAASRMADRAIQAARAIEEPFSELLENALTTKATILTEHGRTGEAEEILFDGVLERLDDINELDTERHANALVELASVCIENSEHDRAREILKSAWAMSAEQHGKMSETAGKIYIQMGRLLMRTNQREKGIEALRRGRDTLKARSALGFRIRAVLNEYGC